MCVLARKLRSAAAGRRHPAEPTAGLPRRCHEGHAGTAPAGRGDGRRSPPPTQVAVRRCLSGVTKLPAPPPYAGPMNPGSSPSPRTGRSATTVRRIAAVVAAGVTGPPAPRPRWLMRGRIDLVAVADVIVALICFAATNSKLAEPAPGERQLRGAPADLAGPVRAPGRAQLSAADGLVCLCARPVLGRRGVLVDRAPLPGAILVYVLCLYAVAVRCEAWVVVDRGRGDRDRWHLDLWPARHDRHPHRRGPGAGRRGRPHPARQPQNGSRSRNAGTRGSARCSRSASASPASCTTSSPTTCP